MLRAIKSVKLYPLPITTEAEACNLEGVGSFTARRMLKGLLPPAATPAATASRPASRARAKPARCRTTGDAATSRANDEENIEPRHVSSCLGNELAYSQQGLRQAQLDLAAGSACSLSTASRDQGDSLFRPVGASARRATQPVLSLAANMSALRGEDEACALDVTPRRPTSRARREEEGEGDNGVGEEAWSSDAPRYFSGRWEAWLIVDNREHEYMSVQVKLRGAELREECELIGRSCFESWVPLFVAFVPHDSSRACRDDDCIASAVAKAGSY